MTSKIFLLLFILILSASSSLHSQWVIMKTDADSLVQLGSEQIYNIEFDSARVNFNEVIRRYPKHPVGYFLDAMVEWWGMTIHRNEAVFREDFLDKIDKVIDLCDEILDEKPTDLTALFFKGGALGYRGRYYAFHKQWISAASDGKSAFDIMNESHKKAPQNHDIMLGTGIYNYFASALPEKYPLVRPLMVFLPVANKSLGLAQLRACSADSRYSKTEAKVTLLLAYYSFEKDYRSAYQIANELHNLYPNNPYFHRYLAKTYIKRGMWGKIESEWRILVKRSINNMPGYNNKTAREGLYWVGYALKRKADYDLALKYFKKCDEVSQYIEEDENAFRLASLFKIAEIYYKQKRFKDAKSQFELVLDEEDHNFHHNRAEEYLERLDNLLK